MKKNVVKELQDQTEDIETISVDNYQLERYVDSGFCLSIRNGNIGVRLGQRVYANGRYGASEGTLGIVVGISIPGMAGRTSNVIDVWFEGHNGSDAMKFSDLKKEHLILPH